MTYHARRKLTAWLGLFAICLAAFAPTISHFVRAARMVIVPVCTVDDGQAGHRVSLLSVPIPAMRAAAMTVMAMNGMGPMESMAAMDDPGAMGSMHAMHHGAGMSHHMDGHSDTGSQPMDDCGYCDLLNHVPAVTMVPPAPVAALLLLFIVFVLPALTRYTPFGAFPSGRPRGPPAIS